MVNDFYICFEKSNMWYAKFLKKNFGHVSIFKKITDEQYIYIDPFQNYVGMYLVSKEFLYHKMWTSNVLYLQKDLTCVKRKSKLLVPLTCVSVVSELIGAGKSTYTPYQLFQHLLRNEGAVSTTLAN